MVSAIDALFLPPSSCFNHSNFFLLTSFLPVSLFPSTSTSTSTSTSPSTSTCSLPPLATQHNGKCSEDGTYVRDLAVRFVQWKLQPHLDRGEALDEDKLSDLFKQGREVRSCGTSGAISLCVWMCVCVCVCVDVSGHPAGFGHSSTTPILSLSLTHTHSLCLCLSVSVSLCLCLSLSLSVSPFLLLLLGAPRPSDD